MNSSLDDYTRLFSSLRTDKNQKRWLSHTCNRAPHKPFLLLSILDLIATGSINKNFIEPSFELAETFAGYWTRVMPIGTSGSMSYPFYHLASAGFWHLITQPNVQHVKGRNISSVKRLRELYHGGKFDDDLFSIMINEKSRRKLQSVLITTFFSPEIQPIVFEQGVINQNATQYSAELLSTAEPANQFILTKDVTKKRIKNKIRDQGFRKAIVKLYEHRCSLCGIRMLTPEGHTIVEAAHIIPWNESHNDNPQNGMALCRLCHWSFDEGLMGVGEDYEVLISPAVRQDNNFPGHMETLSGRGIFKPHDTLFWPKQDNLEVHRKTKFRLFR